MLFVIDSLGSGGAQNQLTLLATLFKKNGDEVTVFTYHPSDFFKYRLDQYHIPIIHRPKVTKLGLEVISGLGQVIKDNGVQIIISFLQSPNFFVSLAIRHYGLQVPLIISERFISYEAKWSFKYWMKRYAHHVADHATTNSHHERRRIIAKFLNQENSISTIYNMVDLKYFKRPAKVRSKVYKLLSVASVSPHKNGMCLVDAMAILKDRKKLNFKVSWIGNKVYSIKKRKDYIEEMERAIIEKGLSDHWHWKEPMQDIRADYHLHDALVHPSYREGLPNVICEALSSGLPVIASDVLDHPILLNEERNGFLFDHQSPTVLADKIQEFFELSDDNINEMSRCSRAFAEANFSEAQFFSKYQTIVNRLVKNVE